jgi:beta-lactam-binding protein with PASTA domain
MKACPRCGHQNADDQDFCSSCGAFLDWDPPAEPGTAGTTTQVAATGNGNVAIAAPPSAPEGVALDLLVNGQPVGPATEPLSVPAGGRVTLTARVRNNSSIVDSFTVTVEGLPDGWVTIDRPTAYLLPIGSRDGYEESVVIAVSPPRSPEAEARVWPLTVVATSESNRTRVASAGAALRVEPFWDIAATARPPMTRGRRAGRLHAEVHNKGNAPARVTVTGTDAEDRCQIRTPPVAYKIPAGGLDSIPVVVRPRRPHLFGRPVDHRLELQAQTDSDPPVVSPFPAAYRQRAWIPWWLPLLILLILIGALVAYLLWPRHVTVPDLRKEPSAFAAQKLLEKEGLTLNPAVRTAVRPKVRPGSVIDQAPPPGMHVSKGKAVTLVVAAGRDTVRVPKLTRLKIGIADQRLNKSGLTLGAVQPKLEPGVHVRAQVPRPGVIRRRGSPVNVVVAKPVSAKKKKAAAAAKAGTPAVAGGGAAAAAATLKKAGLTPIPELRIDTAKLGTVLGTDPPKGSPPPPDKIVKLIISAGFPRLAYDDGMSAFTADGATGHKRKTLDPVGTVSGGAWSPDGRRLAYVSASKLYVATLGSKKPPARVLLGDRRRATTASFAPQPQPLVLAFADEAGEVCWLNFDVGSAATCQPVAPGWSVDGLVWHPNGKTLLVAASKPGSHNGMNFTAHALLRFTTGLPFSSRAVDWKGGTGPVTPHHGDRGVIAAAYEPRPGKRLAVVTNLSSPDYRVALVAADDLALDKPDGLPLSGCDVAWRQDGAELAVVQSDPACAGRVGTIVRALPADPRALRIAVLFGGRPTWQPIDLSPALGRALVQGTQR